MTMTLFLVRQVNTDKYWNEQDQEWVAEDGAEPYRSELATRYRDKFHTDESPVTLVPWVIDTPWVAQQQTIELKDNTNYVSFDGVEVWIRTRTKDYPEFVWSVQGNWYERST